MLATKDTHFDDYDETLEGKLLPVKHCDKYESETSWGWQLVDGLAVTKDNKVNIIKGNIIEKPTFGSFALLDRFQKLFENILMRPYDINHFELKSPPTFGVVDEPLEEIIICGFVTSICVISNALMLRAKYPNVKITLRSDLCADINEESHQAALTVMRNCQINVE
jgi:nicotinamidase-related amidase